MKEHPLGVRKEGWEHGRLKEGGKAERKCGETKRQQTEDAPAQQRISPSPKRPTSFTEVLWKEDPHLGLQTNLTVRAGKVRR